MSNRPRIHYSPSAPRHVVPPQQQMFPIVRRLAVAAAVLASTNTFAQPATPEARPFATLLCKYADWPDIEPGTRAHFERYFSANEYPSVAHYWTEVGDGWFTMAGSKTFGWYLLPKPQSQYVNPSGFGVNYELLSQDCAAAADADVRFPDFAGINFIVNTNLDGVYTIGAVRLTRDDTTRFYNATYLDGGVAQLLGHAAHEIGHIFALPHTSGAYGATYDSRWDVMSLPSWNPHPGASVLLPAHPNAWQKMTLGVIPAARRATATLGTTTHVLERLARPPANANPLVLIVPTYQAATAGQSYYTVEVRGGPDAGYDAAFTEPVVVIHRLRNFEGLLVTDVDGNGDPNDEGARWTVGETFVDRENDLRVSIDAREGTGFRVTVTVGDRKLVAVTPSGRRRTIVAGSSDGGTAVAPRPDSAAITFAGAGTTALPWTATTTGRSRRIGIVTPAGAGGATVRWSEDASRLSPGTYIDSVLVRADGLANGPGVFVDTLVVTAPPTLSIGTGTMSLRDSLVTGRSRSHVVTVRLSGPDAASFSWTATTSAPWIVFTPGGDAGTGLGASLSWRHDAAGMAAGTYVDSIVLTVAGGPTTRLVDTLVVRDPLAIALGRTHGSATMRQGEAGRTDSIYVTLTGTWNAGATLDVSWVFGAGNFLRTRTPPPGSGWFVFQRSPGSLAPGTYVNRVRIAVAADTAVNEYYEDTLRVVAAPSRLVLTKYSARDTLENTSWQTMDSVRVQPEGENGTGRKWETRANFAKTNLLHRNGSLPYGSGTGPGWLVWMRNTAGHTPGTWVDTLMVPFSDGSGDSARFIDSLVVTGIPPLQITSDSVRRSGVMGAEYADTLRADGGEGTFSWTLQAGTLPAGITLTTGGHLAGIAESTGTYRFTAAVQAGTFARTREFRIVVTAPVLAQAAVFDRLLVPSAHSALTAAQLRYLDLLGNRNGRFDVGDARAWLALQAAAPDRRPREDR